MTVSYTHLDVYKRQILRREAALARRIDDQYQRPRIVTHPDGLTAQAGGAEFVKAAQGVQGSTPSSK